MLHLHHTVPCWPTYKSLTSSFAPPHTLCTRFLTLGPRLSPGPVSSHSYHFLPSSSMYFACLCLFSWPYPYVYMHCPLSAFLPDSCLISNLFATNPYSFVPASRSQDFTLLFRPGYHAGTPICHLAASTPMVTLYPVADVTRRLLSVTHTNETLSVVHFLTL